MKLMACGEWCPIDEMTDIPGSPQVYRPNLSIQSSGGGDRQAFVKDLMDIVVDREISFEKIASDTHQWQNAALWITFSFALQNKILEYTAQDDVCVARLASALIGQKHLVVRVIHGVAACAPGEPHEALLQSIARSVELLAARIDSPFSCVHKSIPDQTEEDDKVSQNPATGTADPILMNSLDHTDGKQQDIVENPIGNNVLVFDMASEPTDKGNGDSGKLDPLCALLRSTAIAVFTGMSVANSNLATRSESHPVLGSLQNIKWTDWIGWEPTSINAAISQHKNHEGTSGFDVVEISAPKKVETSSNYRDSTLVEEKFGKQNFRVLSEMRILGKNRVAILDFGRVSRFFSEIWCEIGF